MRKLSLFLGFSCFVFLSFVFFACAKDNSEAPITIPFSLEDGRIVFDAVINGQEGRFIFDSGIMHSAFNISPRGLLPIANTKRVINGRPKRTLVYWLNNIQFGDVKIKTNSWFYIGGDTTARLKEREGYDGLLGIRTFEGYWVELSIARSEITLHKQIPKHFINASHSMLKVFSRFEPLYLPLTIDNREFYMNIDTGLMHAFYFPDDIINDKPPEDITKIESNGEIGDYYLVQTNVINVLERTYYNKKIMNNSYGAARRNYASHADTGLIGLDFMQHYDFLFDYRELRKGRTTGMYYIPLNDLSERYYGFFSFIDESPEPGIIDFSMNETGGLVIEDILTGSTAYAMYGLRPGYVITKINGEPIANFAKEELLDPEFFHRVIEFSVLDKEGKERLLIVKEQ